MASKYDRNVSAKKLHEHTTRAMKVGSTHARAELMRRLAKINKEGASLFKPSNPVDAQLLPNERERPIGPLTPAEDYQANPLEFKDLQGPREDLGIEAVARRSAGTPKSFLPQPEPKQVRPFNVKRPLVPGKAEVGESSDAISSQADQYSDMVLEVAKQKVAKLLAELQQQDPTEISLDEVDKSPDLKETAQSRIQQNRKALDLIAIPGVDENAEIRGLNDEGMLEDPDNMSEAASMKGRNFEGRSGYTPFQRELGQTRDKYPRSKGGPTKSFKVLGFPEEGLVDANDIRELPVNDRTAILQQLATGGWSDEMKRLIEAIKSDKELLGPDADEKGEPHPAYLEDMAARAERESQIRDSLQDEYDPTSDSTKDMTRGREGSVIPKVFDEHKDIYTPVAPRLPKRPAGVKKQEIYTEVIADPEKEKKLPFNKRGKSNKVYKSAERFPVSPFANTKALIRKVQEEGEKKPPHSRVSIAARLAGKGATPREAMEKVIPRAQTMATQGFKGPGVDPRVAQMVGPRVNMDVLRAILGLEEELPQGPGMVPPGVSRYKQRQAEAVRERRKIKKTLENEG